MVLRASLIVSRMRDGYKKRRVSDCRTTYELVFVLDAGEGQLLEELIDALSGCGGRLPNNLDVVLARETLAVAHSDLLAASVHLVASKGDYCLFGRCLIEFLHPGFGCLHALLVGRIVYNECGIGVPEVHSVEDHVSLVARQVVELEVDLLAHRLDRQAQVLALHRHSWLLICVDTTVEDLLN